MNEIDIVRAVTEEGYQISPSAVELIKSSISPESLLKYVLSTIDDCIFVIESEHIDLKGFEASKKAFDASESPSLTLSRAQSGNMSAGNMSSGNKPSDVISSPSSEPVNSDRLNNSEKVKTPGSLSDSLEEEGSTLSVETEVVSGFDIPHNNPVTDSDISFSQEPASDLLPSVL